MAYVHALLVGAAQTVLLQVCVTIYINFVKILNFPLDPLPLTIVQNMTTPTVTLTGQGTNTTFSVSFYDIQEISINGCIIYYFVHALIIVRFIKIFDIFQQLL